MSDVALAFPEVKFGDRHAPFTRPGRGIPEGPSRTVERICPFSNSFQRVLYILYLVIFLSLGVYQSGPGSRSFPRHGFQRTEYIGIGMISRTEQPRPEASRPFGAAIYQFVTLYQCHFAGLPPDVENQSFLNSDQLQSEHIYINSYYRVAEMPGHVQRLDKLRP